MTCRELSNEALGNKKYFTFESRTKYRSKLRGGVQQNAQHIDRQTSDKKNGKTE